VTVLGVVAARIEVGYLVTSHSPAANPVPLQAA
jgi:hypothetical protein